MSRYFERRNLNVGKVFERRTLNVGKLFEKRRIVIVVLVSVLLSLFLLITLQTQAITSIRQKIGGDTVPELELDKKLPVPPKYAELDGNTPQVKEKLAIATFLTGNGETDDNLEDDLYFNAVRILVWQLIHQPETKTKHDVVVVVTPTVSKSRRDRLKKDGAIVYPVKRVKTENTGWIKSMDRFEEVMMKLRIWEMTHYSRILLMDGDSMLRSSIDGVFDDPGAQIMRTKNRQEGNFTVWTAKPRPPLPETYLMASLCEVWDSTHKFPPGPRTGLKDYGNLNAGFFMIAPSKAAFNYYRALMNIEGSFDPIYPEQNLMNHAHHWDGPMPWREVSYSWNVRCPNENDFNKGVVSVHEKWWTQPYIYKNDKVKQWLHSRRYEMKGWYDGFELKKQNQQAQNETAPEETQVPNETAPEETQVPNEDQNLADTGLDQDDSPDFNPDSKAEANSESES